MAQSLSRIWIHLVFSTKQRQPFLRELSFREEMFGMLGHHVAEAGCQPRLSGGWIDHVHLICGLARTVTIAELVEHVKKKTSNWAKKEPHRVEQFAWQSGYGAFSVSESKLNDVIRYIEQQEKHHKRRSFQDEFRELCRRHCIEIDEKYVWD